MMLDQRLLEAPVIEHDQVDLDGADRVRYLLEQSFSYSYLSPVEQLRQRLVVVPPQRHGNQRLLAHRLQVEGARARRETRRDRHGNTVVRLRADRVEHSVSFRISALLERVRADGPTRVSAAALVDPRLLAATRLTAPDDRLRAQAELLRRQHPAAHRSSAGALELAASLCRWVHQEISYEYGITSVRTTAAEALAGGRGVCQDSAHVMLALCHLLSLPARYVSGHLLGQGGTHAWVEVLVAAGDHALAMPFDPCNGVAGSARYVTIATGRDYADVRPTSGSYVGAATGNLTTSRRVAVLAVA
ncbi:MAG: transglutaminase family protein [Jatrophihabitantaceae bacterium]